MPLNTDAKKNIIKKVISNQDYRDEVLVIIDEIFLDYCISFFKQVVYAKIDTLGEKSDWYKKVFLNLQVLCVLKKFSIMLIIQKSP